VKLGQKEQLRSDFLTLSDILWTLKLGTNQPKQPLEWTLQVPKFSPLNRLPGKLEQQGSQVAAGDDCGLMPQKMVMGQKWMVDGWLMDD
jgi:hypothetical protein